MKHSFTKKLMAAGLVASAFVMAAPISAFAKSPHAAPTWTGLSAPESVLYDYQKDTYLVSNINGSPWAKDNNGYIAKADPDKGGAVERWIEGGKNNITLNAPKGSVLSGATLWVTDLDTVRGFDRWSGKPVANIHIAGSTFLNDITADKRGNLYVTDTGMNPDQSPNYTDAMYRINQRGNVKKLFTGLQPNGITLAGHKLLVVTRGGQIAHYDLVTRKLSIERTLPTPRLDGVQVLPNGTALISTNPATDVGMWKLPNRGDPTEYLSDFDFMTGAADFTIDYRRQRLVMPILFSDQMTSTPLRRAML